MAKSTTQNCINGHKLKIHRLNNGHWCMQAAEIAGQQERGEGGGEWKHLPTLAHTACSNTVTAPFQHLSNWLLRSNYLPKLSSDPTTYSWNDQTESEKVDVNFQFSEWELRMLRSARPDDKQNRCFLLYRRKTKTQITFRRDEDRTFFSHRHRRAWERTTNGLRHCFSLGYLSIMRPNPSFPDMARTTGSPYQSREGWRYPREMQCLFGWGYFFVIVMIFFRERERGSSCIICATLTVTDSATVLV